MYDSTNLTILTYLPRLPPWKTYERKQQDNTELQTLPNRLLDFFMLSQQPFRAGTIAKFNPRMSF